MATSHAGAILRQLHRFAQTHAVREASDGQLLERFAVQREEEAFAALMRRHGRLVWSVCRHILPSEHDAEDAFQATFLVLARRATSIRKSESVGSWLHGVAYRLAVRAKQMTAKRQQRERRVAVAESIAASSDPALRELQALLDEEVTGLPERYRVPFVMCCLEGRCWKDAAAELGWKEGTLSTRIAHARKLLQTRLARRGVTLSAALTAGALWNQTASAALLRTTLAVAVGRIGFSPAVTSLATSAFRTLSAGKLVVSVALVLAVVTSAVGYRFAASGLTSPQRKQGNDAAVGLEDSTHPTRTEKTDAFGDPLPAGAVARLGTVRFRHGFNISSIAFSPDGKAIATGSYDRTLRLWDTATGEELGCFTTQPLLQILRVAFSPDGKILASGDNSNRVVLWDRNTGNSLRELQLHDREGIGQALAFAPDGKTLASGGKKIVLWDVATGKELRRLQGQQDDVFSVAFSPDGKQIASGAGDKTIRLWDAATGKELRRLDVLEGVVLSVTFSPDGKLLASGSADKTAQVWDADTGKEIRKLQVSDKYVRSVSFSPDGKTLAVASGEYGTGTYFVMTGRVMLFDVGTGESLRQLSGDRLAFESVTFSPDGKTVAAAGGHDAKLHLWDTATGKELHRAGHESSIDSTVFSADGRTIVTSGWNEKIRFWETASGKELRQFPGYHPWVSPDEKTLLAITDWPNPTLQVRDLATGRERRQFRLRPEEPAVAISPDGRMLATAGKAGVIRLWDTASGEEARQLTGHSAIIYHLDFLADGTTLVSTSADKTTRFWDARTGKELRRIPGECQVHALSKDLRAAPGEDGSIHITHLATGKEQGRPVKNDNQFTQVLQTLCFSPDGRTLALGCYTGEIRLWETATGQERRTFTGHRGRIDTLAFSPDGRLLVSGSSDTTALVWDLSDGALNARGALTAAALDNLWADLASEDASKAYQAIWKLAASPAQTVSLLKERIQPVPHGDSVRIARFLADLDSDTFEVRDKATKELERLADSAQAALRETLAKAPSVEVRRRVEQLLAKLDGLGTKGEPLRTSRAIETLERIGTPEARQLLDKLAAGAPGAWQTREAKAAAKRIRP
jgi:RNA polymerase sigma factor (sigma-70 family)